MEREARVSWSTEADADRCEEAARGGRHTGEARSRGAMDGDGHRWVPWPTPHRSPGAPSVAASASRCEPAAMGGGGGGERRPQPPRPLTPGVGAALSTSRERGSEEERD